MKTKIELDWKRWPEVPYASDLPVLIQGRLSGLELYCYLVPDYLLKEHHLSWTTLRLEECEQPDALAKYGHVKAIREAFLAASGAMSAEQFRIEFNEVFLREASK